MLDIQAIIISAIRVELSQREISQNKLAKELGVTQQQLNYILKGQRGMGLDFLSRALTARPQWAKLLIVDGATRHAIKTTQTMEVR